MRELSEAVWSLVGSLASIILTVAGMLARREKDMDSATFYLVAAILVLLVTNLPAMTR